MPPATVSQVPKLISETVSGPLPNCRSAYCIRSRFPSLSSSPIGCTVPLPTSSSTRSTQPRSAATLMPSGSRTTAYSPFFSRWSITFPGPGAASAALFSPASISSVARSRLMRMRIPVGSFTCTSSSGWMGLTEIFGAESSSPEITPRTSTGTSIFNCSASFS